jgi:DNA-binding helix-hairpin-helix protein with protein kinase domain
VQQKTTPKPKPKKTTKQVKKPVKNTFLNSFGVYTSTNQRLNINADKSCGGGEATIHESEDGDYAKIFNNQVDIKHKKSIVEVLHKAKFSNSIVTPKEILYDDKQNFIGYTMPKQDGVELGKLLIGKVTDYFPEYTLIETLDIALSVIKIFEETKARKVVVGDVNPRNILVANKDNVSLAYMEEYRRPRHRGKSIQSYLRKYSDDCFSVATIIFQLLHFGLLPYGGSDEQSLNESIYIFNPYYPEKNLTTNKVLIKAHSRLSENLKLAFRDIFKNDKYVLISTLKEHILAYKNMLLEVQKNKGG